MTTLLMIALILLLGDSLAGGKMLGAGSRKGGGVLSSDEGDLPPKTSREFMHWSRRMRKGIRRLAVGSGGLFGFLAHRR